jgi:hypothetical protein
MLKVTDKNSRSRIRDPLVKGADPDPFQNVTDPQYVVLQCWHCWYLKTTDNYLWILTACFASDPSVQEIS